MDINSQASVKNRRYTRHSVAKSAFVQVPLFLFHGAYKDLSSNERLLYGLLQSRHRLSVKSGWFNSNDEVFFLYKREEMAEMLGVSKRTIIKTMDNLKKFNLIDEERQGLGRSNRIYLLEPESIDTDGVESQDINNEQETQCDAQCDEYSYDDETNEHMTEDELVEPLNEILGEPPGAKQSNLVRNNTDPAQTLQTISTTCNEQIKHNSTIENLRKMQASGNTFLQKYENNDCAFQEVQNLHSKNDALQEVQNLHFSGEKPAPREAQNLHHRNAEPAPQEVQTLQNEMLLSPYPTRVISPSNKNDLSKSDFSKNDFSKNDFIKTPTPSAHGQNKSQDVFSCSEHSSNQIPNHKNQKPCSEHSSNQIPNHKNQKPFSAQEKVDNSTAQPKKNSQHKNTTESEKEKFKEVYSLFDFIPKIQTVVDEWIDYKKEKNQGYKPLGLKKILATIQKMVAQYGEDAVIETIDMSMSCNYNGIIWDKLTKLTQNKESNPFLEMMQEHGYVVDEVIHNRFSKLFDREAVFV